MREVQDASVKGKRLSSEHLLLEGEDACRAGGPDEVLVQQLLVLGLQVDSRPRASERVLTRIECDHEF